QMCGALRVMGRGTGGLSVHHVIRAATTAALRRRDAQEDTMTSAYHSAQIPAAGVVLEADIMIARPARGMVLFAHGSGSSRFSPRNRYVAQQLQQAGLATVLADLLTPAEEKTDARTGAIRFDISLLTTRLTHLTDWLADQQRTADLSCGYFGASTGAAAALAAAAQRPGRARPRGPPPRRRADGGFPRRPPRPGRPVSAPGAPGDTADRRRARPCRAEDQPASRAENPRQDTPGDSPRSIAPVRGTRSPGPGGPPGPRLVCRTPHIAVRTACALSPLKPAQIHQSGAVQPAAPATWSLPRSADLARRRPTGISDGM